MNNQRKLYKNYEKIVPAMGCTEPIALAYCAAVARKELGVLPKKVTVEASGNIIKNVKSVIVPNTDGARGIEAAAAIGIVAGREDLALEVLSKVTEEQKEKFRHCHDKEKRTYFAGASYMPGRGIYSSAMSGR